MITAKIVFYGFAKTVQKDMRHIYQASSGKIASASIDPMSVFCFESEAVTVEDKKLRLLFMGTADHPAGRLLMLKGADIVVFCWSEEKNEDQNKEMISELCLNLEKLGLGPQHTKLTLLFERSKLERSSFAMTVSDHFNRTVSLSDVFDLNDPQKVYNDIVCLTQKLVQGH